VESKIRGGWDYDVVIHPIKRIRRVGIPKPIRRQRRTIHDTVVPVATPVVSIPIERIGSNQTIRDDRIATATPLLITVIAKTNEVTAASANVLNRFIGSSS